jgi:DNA-binding NarL/FixJ family response regulator
MASPPDLTSTVRVLIVDDEPDLRLLMRTMLDLDHRIDIIGEAADGGEALERFAELRPDLVLLDLRMPVMNGLEVAQRILQDHPDQRILLFTAFLDPRLAADAAAIGISGVLGKGDLDALTAEILRLAG